VGQGAVIGCANPASPDFESTLQSLLAASPKMRGIRWILNWPGFITPTRPDQDYLKSEAFRQGYPLLAKYDLVFDLQLNAPQLAEACVTPDRLSSQTCLPAESGWGALARAEFIASVPEVPVCLEHTGMPVIWPLDAEEPDAAALDEWREGMKLMAVSRRPNRLPGSLATSC